MENNTMNRYNSYSTIQYRIIEVPQPKVIEVQRCGSCETRADNSRYVCACCGKVHSRKYRQSNDEVNELPYRTNPGRTVYSFYKGGSRKGRH